MKKDKKNLAFLKIEEGSSQKRDLSANYFADLEFVAVTRKTFLPEKCRHKSFPCPGNSAGLEYISRGMVFLHLDGRRVLLKAPCIFWIIGDYKKYRFEFVEESPEYEHFWVDFRGERALRIREALYHFSDESFQEIDPADDPFGNLFKELHFSFHKDREKEHNNMVIILEKILSLLYDLRRQDQKDESDPYGIKELADHFRKHPFDNYDLESLAGKRDLSLMHFRALFKEKTSMPPRAYLEKARMDQACRMLETGRMRISEVAAVCRYPDPASFTRAFTRLFKCSPRQWLKKRESPEEKL